MMKRLRRQRPFLESVLKEANRFKRPDMLTHANADPISAVGELVLNLLKKCTQKTDPIDALTYGKFKRHKNGKAYKLVETSKRTSLEANRKRILEWVKWPFQSMLCSLKGRDEERYPLEGMDVVPEKKPPLNEWLPLYWKERLVQYTRSVTGRQTGDGSWIPVTVWQFPTCWRWSIVLHTILEQGILLHFFHLFSLSCLQVVATRHKPSHLLTTRYGPGVSDM